MRSATVVLPVPGLPVKLMCSEGREDSSPASRRSRSITSSAAISRIRVLTGCERDEVVVELGEHLPRSPRRAGRAASSCAGLIARAPFVVDRPLAV